MRYIDSPSRYLADRTPREAAFLAIVLACSIVTFGHWPEFMTTTGVGVIFALRIPQARPIAVGFCLGWLAAMAAIMRVHGWDLTNLRVVLPAVALVLLTSRDLFHRFDAAPARWLPNVWRELPTRHWRAMRWCAYSLGILVALVVPGWLWTATNMGFSTTAPTWITGGVVLSLALLVLGQASGFIVAAGVATAVLLRLAPGVFSEANPIFDVWPAMLAPICLAAVAVLLLSLPYCARLFIRR